MYRTAEMLPGVANSHIKIGTFQRLPGHPNSAEIDAAKSAVAELKETMGHNESDPEFLKRFSSRIARNCGALSRAKSSISATQPRAQNCHCESLVSNPGERDLAAEIATCAGPRATIQSSSRITASAGLSSRSALNFRWRRWRSCVHSRNSIAAINSGFSQRHLFTSSAVRPRPICPYPIREDSETGIWRSTDHGNSRIPSDAKLA
jgi:hypothetical protein